MTKNEFEMKNLKKKMRREATKSHKTPLKTKAMANKIYIRSSWFAYFSVALCSLSSSFRCFYRVDRAHSIRMCEKFNNLCDSKFLLCILLFSGSLFRAKNLFVLTILDIYFVQCFVLSFGALILLRKLLPLPPFLSLPSFPSLVLAFFHLFKISDSKYHT